MGFYQAQKIEKLEARIKRLEAELACSIVSGNDAHEQALGYVYELNDAAARIEELEALLSDVNTGYAECIAEREDLKVALTEAVGTEKRIWIDALLENLPEEKAILFREICLSADNLRAARAVYLGKDQ